MSETAAISAESLAALQGRVAQLEATQRESQDQALIASGRGREVVDRLRQETAEAMVQHRVDAAEDRRRVENYAADNALKDALAHQPLADAAAVDQVANLLRGELATAVDPASGTAHVRSRDGRSVDELVRERLGRPEFARFLKPGAAPAPAAPLAAPGTPSPHVPPALSPEVLQFTPMHIRTAAMQQARQAAASNPAVDVTQAFGLTRRR